MEVGQPMTQDTDGNESGIIERFRNRVRWWYAGTFGEHPRCECGGKANCYLSSEGYVCMMCYVDGQPYQGVGYVRDLRPSDHF